MSTNEQSNEALVAHPQNPMDKYDRNSYGLITSTDYVFNEDGSINWRAMIKPEFLYPNKDWFDIRKKPVPESTEGLDDKQLLIMLAGIKELAKLRGFRKVSYNVSHVGANYVFATCKIQWIGNYETNYDLVEFEDVANATADNTDDFCLKFLETIACNRAFVRCVRNFLNIHIVGADEIDKSKNRVADIGDLIVSNALPISAQGTLEKAVNEKLKLQSFEEFKTFLRTLWKKANEEQDKPILELLEEAKNWKEFKDISAKTARVLLKIINEHQKNN
jgi:hypothetical protein